MSDQKVLEFVVSLEGNTFESRETRVRVQWTAELGRQGSPVHRAIADALEIVKGAEQVAVERYSAEVVIARHVVDGIEAVREVVESLETDGEIPAFAEPLGISVVKVTTQPPFLDAERARRIKALLH